MRYRIRQFWRVLRVGDASEADLALAREVLTAKQMGLFRIMHPAEIDHAIRVLKKLQARGKRIKTCWSQPCSMMSGKAGTR